MQGNWLRAIAQTLGKPVGELTELDVAFFLEHAITDRMSDLVSRKQVNKMSSGEVQRRVYNRIATGGGVGPIPLIGATDKELIREFELQITPTTVRWARYALMNAGLICMGGKRTGGKFWVVKVGAKPPWSGTNVEIAE